MCYSRVIDCSSTASVILLDGKEEIMLKWPCIHIFHAVSSLILIYLDFCSVYHQFICDGLS